MEMAEYIVSKKNKPKITRNGNLFVFDKQSKKDPIIKFWRCERKNNCKAGIQTKDDVVITEIYVHSRGASATSVEIATFKTSLSAKMITPPVFSSLFFSWIFFTYIDALSDNLPLERHSLLHWFEDN